MATCYLDATDDNRMATDDDIQNSIDIVWSPSLLADDMKEEPTSKAAETSAKRLRKSMSKDELLAEVEAMRARVASQFDSRVILPNNPQLIRWDFMAVLALAFTAFVTPVDVAFIGDSLTPLSALSLANRLVDIVFIFDMYVQFHLAYDDHASGCLVRERRTIRRNYLRGWFAVDFVSVVPFDLLSTLSMGSASLREMKVIRLVKLLRLLKLTRVTKVSHIFQRYEASLNISYSYSTLDLAKAVLRIATIAHWSVLDEPFVHRRTLLFVALARGSDAASAQL